MEHSQESLQVEEQRWADAVSRQADWKRWGTYLPERQWGTVREDDSPDGNPWTFTYDLARYKAYLWGEDGLLDWTDRECRLCYSTSFWNGKDPYIKERLFGLTNPQGNHGEDVKELYSYLDATPTHAYARGLYQYPQSAFPYEALTGIKRQRGLKEPEYELLDTGVFDGERYFDCEIEYAKQAPNERRYAKGSPWQDLLLFKEYFFGDTGRGVGASHQTGWTACISLCLETAHRLEVEGRSERAHSTGA